MWEQVGALGRQVISGPHISPVCVWVIQVSAVA